MSKQNLLQAQKHLEDAILIAQKHIAKKMEFMNKRKFAKLAGVSHAYIFKTCDMSIVPSVKFLVKILDALEKYDEDMKK